MVLDERRLLSIDSSAHILALLEQVSYQRDVRAGSSALNEDTMLDWFSAGLSRTFFACIVTRFLIRSHLVLPVRPWQQLLHVRETLLFTQLQIALNVRAVSVRTNFKLIRNVADATEERTDVLVGVGKVGETPVAGGY